MENIGSFAKLKIIRLDQGFLESCKVVIFISPEFMSLLRHDEQVIDSIMKPISYPSYLY